MLKNMMELIAEEKLEHMLQSSPYCKCKQCREDILALTLNGLAPHYVASDAGRLYARAKMLSAERDFDVTRELAKAMELVGNHPRH